MERKRRKLKVLIFVICGLGGLYGWLRTTAGPVPSHPFYSNSQLETIAHRGGAGERPENTLAALEHAASIGVDILEFDIRLSQDGHLILLHDKTLNRTTNCQGPVSEKKLAELEQCDAGFWFTSDSDQSSKSVGIPSARSLKFPFRGKGVQVPTLEAVFNRFHNSRMIIEIKPPSSEISNKFCGLILKYKMETKVLVGSFHQEVLDDFRNYCPDVATSASPGEVIRFYFFTRIGLAELYTPPVTALQIPPRIKSSFNYLPILEVITPQLVSKAHSKNIVIQAWTINDPEEMLSLKLTGVDGIMTDVPSTLINTLTDL